MNFKQENYDELMRQIGALQALIEMGMIDHLIAATSILQKGGLGDFATLSKVTGVSEHEARSFDILIKGAALLVQQGWPVKSSKGEVR
ncbi:hypothetical protein I2494_04555 [Budviciaceae bacterium BWR-B9]|uniref:Uncharacterized protein n=1 Tax=Limnobaculum allomyrinae TaxID=2791986 RepID=A0ABS1IML9_9GAMM|nr:MULTISPECIES: hypothetical protein [Limnobaculum]MBK5142994.1 hypothetical protein [Limnobaculum allomyrinae]MBV7693323.1 hypothetical protein [Limnobaculum sp. M2-1]